MRTPCAPSTADASEIEPEEAEALASTKVHDSTLFFFDLDLWFSQLLPRSFFHRLHQPVTTRIGVNQDHQIVNKTRVLDEGVLAGARSLLRPLQHPIHLIEVEIAEQWRDHSALRDASLTIGFEHNLQQVHHVADVDPF